MRKVKLRTIVFNWVSTIVNEKFSSELLNDFLKWLHIGESVYLRDNGFDPLSYLREVNLVVKMSSTKIAKESTTEDIIELNSVLIENYVPFESRLKIISRLIK